MASVAPSNPLWLYDAKTDLLLGCGLAYVGVFLLLFFFGSSFQSILPLAITPIIGLLISAPHYGATLLRVYSKQAERQKYQFFSIYMTALVWGLFVLGVYKVAIGSFLITLYLLWSPWHYMGQNYGIALMFLGRGQLKISSSLKKIIHLSFLSSYFLTLVQLESTFGGATFHYTIYKFPFTPIIRDSFFIFFGLIYIITTFISFYSLLQQSHIKNLMPAFLLFASQALWFLVPIFAMRFNFFQNTVALSAEQGIYVFFWTAIAHAIQYLWVTNYYSHKEDQSRTPVFLGRSLMAGCIVWVIPVLVFAPNVLGSVPYDAGFGLLVAATVNLHHFVLDGAIWKLKSGPIAKILLRDVSQHAHTLINLPSRQYRIVFLTAGLFCLAVNYYGNMAAIKADQAFESENVQELTAAIEDLKLTGRDSAFLRSKAAIIIAINEKDYDKAISTAEEAVHIYPAGDTWSSLSYVYEQAGQISKALPPAMEAVKQAPQSSKFTDRLNSLASRELSASINPEESVSLALAKQIYNDASITNPQLYIFASRVFSTTAYKNESYKSLTLARQLAHDGKDTNLISLIDDMINKLP